MREVEDERKIEGKPKRANELRSANERAVSNFKID